MVEGRVSTNHKPRLGLAQQPSVRPRSIEAKSPLAVDFIRFALQPAINEFPEHLPRLGDMPCQQAFDIAKPRPKIGRNAPWLQRDDTSYAINGAEFLQNRLLSPLLRL